MKAVLFDLDGTLTDSGEGIMNCARLALSHYGIEVADEASLRVFVGPPLAETFLKFGVPAEEVDHAIEIYRSRYIPIGKYENKPYPGIRELLEKLRLRATGCMLPPPSRKPPLWIFWSILILPNTLISLPVPPSTMHGTPRPWSSPTFWSRPARIWML